MIVKLLTEHLLECLSLKGGCRGSSESIHVKIPHCWKSHALAQFMFIISHFRRAHLKQIESDQNVNDIASVSVPGSMKTSSDETEKSETSSYHSTSKDTER